MAQGKQAAAVKVLHIDRVVKRLGKFESIASKHIADAMLAGAKDIEKIIKKKISQPGTGRKYRRPGGRIHQASAPNKPPARDTGGLYKSIGVETHHKEKNPYVIVGSFGRLDSKGRAIGAHLEYGTSKMKPRPWLKVSFQEGEVKNKKRLEKAYRKAVKNAGKK